MYKTKPAIRSEHADAPEKKSATLLFRSHTCGHVPHSTEIECRFEVANKELLFGVDEIRVHDLINRKSQFKDLSGRCDAVKVCARVSLCKCSENGLVKMDVVAESEIISG